MPSVNIDQANFSKGVLDPRAYARTDFEGYYQSAKTINNALVIPQGGVQRRWGTTYVATLNAGLNPATHPEFTEISTLTIGQAIYLLQWEAGHINIYLENVFVAIVATPYVKEDIQNLRWAQVLNNLIVCCAITNAPYQLVRNNDAPQNITAFSAINNTLTLNIGTSVTGIVLPAQFATTGALPTTFPQIIVGKTYYTFSPTLTTVEIYSTPDDAKNRTNVYTISALGNNSTLIFQHSWTFNPITFINVPTYDFNGGYGALTFTPSATTGTITITASGNIFSAAFNGGVFIGAGGIVRLTTNVSATVMNGFVEVPFLNTNPIQGSISYLGEPAWSAARGYPSVVSFFQNRLVMANNSSLPNGIWLSAVNSAFDFDDSETLPDNAISWYPAAAQSNIISALTPGRSLIAHTDTGNYSTPFAVEQPLTPTNFAMTEQNKDGVSNLQPVFIDNQIIYVDKSGNNVKNMIWEITQSSFVLNNISIAATSLIKQPVDMTAFTDPQFTDGYYVIFVNNDGTLAILQTLHEQQIAAWTSADAVYTFDNLNRVIGAGYKHVTSSIGSTWFICQRTTYVAGATTAITAFNGPANTLTAVASGIPVGAASQVAFTTANAFPTTVPQIVGGQFFWVNGVDANDFSVYPTQADAVAQTNPFQIIDFGVNASVTVQTPTNVQYIEQLDFTVPSDSAITQTGVNSATVNNLAPLNGNYVAVYADGLALAPVQVVAGSVTLPQVVQNVTIGIPFTSTLQLLPIGNIPGTPSNLYKTKHIRGLYINCYQTLGATIQGFPLIVPTIPPQEIIQELNTPKSGVYLYNMMEDWDSTQFNITIQQTNPLPMTILGVSYILELT